MNIQKVKKIKTGVIFKKGDIIVYALLVVLIVSFFLIFLSGEPGFSVNINFEDDVRLTVPLDVDAEYTVTVNLTRVNNPQILDGDRCEEILEWNSVCARDERLYFSHIIIKDGFVWVSETNCRDHLCKMMGVQNKVGASIICLPMHITVAITK